MSSQDPHESRPYSTGAVLDPAVLLALRELGGTDEPDLLRELIDMYLQDAPQRIAEIESGLATGDWKLLERAAHTLKSSSANIGALALSNVCQELERQSRTHDQQACTRLYQQSTEHLARVEGALRTVRS